MSRLATRLQKLEGPRNSSGLPNVVFYSIWAPSPDGPVRTGDSIAKCIGHSNAPLVKRRDETQDEFSERVQSVVDRFKAIDLQKGSVLS